MRVCVLVRIRTYAQGSCCGSLARPPTVDVDERSLASSATRRGDSVAAASACEISSRRPLPYFRAIGKRDCARF